MNAKRLIVSRHPAAVEFVRAECPDFADAPVLAAATADDVRGAIVAGNLPLHLACLCREILAVEFKGSAPRGAEYTLDEMRAAGARTARYRVLSEDRVAVIAHRIGEAAAADGCSAAIDWAQYLREEA